MAKRSALPDGVGQAIVKRHKFVFERTIFALTIVFLGVPFFATWIVVANPAPEVGSSPYFTNFFDQIGAFCFGGTLSISLAINLTVFVWRRRKVWHRPLPLSVAIAQAALFVVIGAWLVTQQPNVTVFERSTTCYFVILAESMAIMLLSIFVCVRASGESLWLMPEPDPSSQTNRVLTAET